MTPIKQTWDVGKDKHGRRVLLHCEGDSFTIEAQPVSQRDDGERHYSLTRDVLINIGKVAMLQKP